MISQRVKIGRVAGRRKKDDLALIGLLLAPDSVGLLGVGRQLSSKDWAGHLRDVEASLSVVQRLYQAVSKRHVRSSES
jgi:hypothetical protein